ncbi:MAG: co-chaperone GroES [Planctomycetota bacterium]|jgi:chaperonin GroES
MKVRPLGDKILVKRAEAQDKTDAGIFLPEAAKDQPKEGKVLAVGSGILNKNTGEYMPFTVREGDQVIFSTYSGTEVKIGDEEMLILSEDDILCVVE